MIYDYSANSLDEALKGLLNKIQKIAEQEKKMKFIY